MAHQKATPSCLERTSHMLRHKHIFSVGVQNSVHDAHGILVALDDVEERGVNL